MTHVLQNGHEAVDGKAHDGAGITVIIDRPPRFEAFGEVVGPGLAPPCAAGDVFRNAGIAEIADSDVGAIRKDDGPAAGPISSGIFAIFPALRYLSRRRNRYKRHARDDEMLAVLQRTDDAFGIGGIAGLANELVAFDDHRIGADDDARAAGVRLGEALSACASLEVRKRCSPVGGVRLFARLEECIINAGVDRIVRDPPLLEEHASAGGLAGEDHAHTSRIGRSIFPRNRPEIQRRFCCIHLRALNGRIRFVMRAHMLQLDLAWEDREANFAKVERMLDGAEPAEGDLVILPEMFDSGFSFNVERTADRDGTTLQWLIRMAEDLGVYMMGGRTVHACHACLAHNRATVISPAGDLLADYSKVHPFTFGREAERFEGGDDVVVWTWAAAGQQTVVSRHAPGAALAVAAGGTRSAGGTPRGEEQWDEHALRVCPTVCYDLRFPELFRIGLLKGAEMFTVIANWPEARQQHWRALAIARAIENQAFVLAVNRTGNDPHLGYAGGTIGVDPQGNVLGELGREERVLTVEIDPGALHAWRAKFPAWRDVRLVELQEAR